MLPLIALAWEVEQKDEAIDSRDFSYFVAGFNIFIGLVLNIAVILGYDIDDLSTGLTSKVPLL
jgi:hypothetical protein